MSQGWATSPPTVRAQVPVKTSREATSSSSLPFPPFRVCPSQHLLPPPFLPSPHSLSSLLLNNPPTPSPFPQPGGVYLLTLTGSTFSQTQETDLLARGANTMRNPGRGQGVTVLFLS